jgi:uncharacterized phiE125 gp8 family phage protein
MEMRRLSSDMEIRRLQSDNGLPISLDALKLDLRVDDGDEDNTLERMAQAAAMMIEGRSGYVLVPGLFEAEFDFIGTQTFMREPLRELVKLEAMTAKNTWTELDLGDFQLRRLARGFQLSPFHCFQHPCLYPVTGGVRLQFTAGFDTEGESEGTFASSGEDRPIDPLVRGVYIALVAHFYENRELFEADKLSEIESKAGGLLNSIRTFW